MKVAVVGGGIFGCVSALKLSANGHKVDLFEREGDILKCASGINQYRLHRGYHYPRSKETVEYVKKSSILFEEEFPTAICRQGFERYYAISNKGSLTSEEDYLIFLERNQLEWNFVKAIDLPIIKPEKIDLVVKVVEHGFDLTELYLIISSRLTASKVNLKMNKAFTKTDMEKYDIVINATYSNINNLLEEDQRVLYQYELCEKPIVQLPQSFKGKSVVILDGEFCCVDPIGFNIEYQVLGHVKEAIHNRQISTTYTLPIGYESILNRGAVYSDLSKFDRILEGFREYFNVEDVTYKGSMYTVRTVLPQHEFDDARPSLIKQEGKIISIFSGKIGTCVDTANNILKLIT